MDLWFSRWRGDQWNEGEVKRLLSKNFVLEIESLVDHLNLVPKIGNPKHSNGVVNFSMRRWPFSVAVKRFSFGTFRRIEGDNYPYYTPVFEFDIVVTSQKVGRVPSGVTNMIVAYKGSMIVTFPENYPRHYPFFMLPKYRMHIGGSHSEHMYTGGYMCLYDDLSRAAAAWNPRLDTSATAFGKAARWVQWREYLRGEGVDADDINE